MSSSTSTNNIRKNSDFVDTLSKLTKQSNEYSEMNSINSTILLNPTAIKNNFPVINQLYQPIFSQRQDTIDSTKININSISNTINPLFLATSFQTLQNNKINFHPYYRNNSSQINVPSKNFNNRNTNQISKINQTFLNNFQTNSINQPVNLYNVNTNSIIPYNYNLINKSDFNPSISNINYNIKLSEEKNSDKTKSCPTQIIVSQPANNFSSKNDNSRLSNDCSNNWLINNQIKNQINNSSNISLSNKPNQNKRRLPGKNFTYSDKNAVDSVKKLDKIILNHNKNLQEIIKHKNQLIKTITSNQFTTNRNSKETYMQIINSQPSYPLNRNLNKSSNFIQADTLIKNKSINNQASFSNLNNSINSSKYNSNQQKNSVNSNNFSNASSNHNYKNVVNGNKVIKKSLNEQTKDLFDSAISLNAITKAMNEEAELNKQKLNQSKKTVKKNDCIIQKPSVKANVVKTNNDLVTKTNEKIIIEENKIFVSKLDERENRLQLKRKKEESNNESTNSIFNSLDVFYNENYENDCYIDEIDEEISDVEYNDEYAYRLKYSSIIMQAPRAPLKLNQNKLNYFSNLGLTTAESKAELDFEKFVRTKKILKEISIEKENEENCSENKKLKLIKKSDQILSPSKISPDDLKNENSNKKLSFFNVLGLKEQKNTDEIKLKELFWEGVLEDRERRRVFNLCFEKSLDNLDPETKENWLKNLENENSKNLNQDIQLNIISNNNNRIPSSDGLLTTVSQLKAYQKLSNIDNSNYSQDLIENTNEDKSLFKETSSLQSKFTWPGINIILKSYSEFSNAKNLEKKSLLEKIKKLNQAYNEKTNESENLKLKLSFLIQADKDLNEDHDKLKLLISNLKYNLSQF